MNKELYEKLTRLQWLLHKQQLRGWAHGGPIADTTRGQGRILALLKLRDDISTKDLSYMLGMAVSSLNELLAKLEKGGFITREPSEQDKRIILVRLTDKGRSEEQQGRSDIGDIFDCLTEEEQAMLSAILDKLIAALGEKLGFDEDDIEKLKARNAERDRMFAEMGDMDKRGFYHHDFRYGFGEPPVRHGAPHGREHHGRDFHGRDFHGRSQHRCDKHERDAF